MVDDARGHQASQSRMRRFLIAALGTEELSWMYIVPNQALLVVTFRTVTQGSQSGLGRAAYFVALVVGQAWLIYHVIRKLRARRNDAPDQYT